MGLYPSIFVKRMTFGTSQDLTVDDFVSGTIDYRHVGDRKAQLAALSEDYERVGWKSLHTVPNRRLQVDEAFQNYFDLICNGYQK